MSGLAQGAVFGDRLALGLLRKAAFLAISSLAIHGCTIGGRNTAALDSALATASVPTAPQTIPDEGLVADGQAILAVLTAGDEGSDTALPWENPESGARGLITAYSGEVQEGRDCLAFTTTRENFEGIGLYRGTACEDPAGILRIRELVAE